MGRSFLASVVVHLTLAVLLVVLSGLGRALPPEETPITVEIVTELADPQPSPLPPKAPPAQTAPLPPRQAAAPAPPPPPPPPPKVEAPPKPAPPPPPPKLEPPPPPPKKVEAPKPPPEPKKAEAPPPPEAKPAKPKPAPAKVAEPPTPPKPAVVAKAEPKPAKPPTPPAPKQEESDFDALLRSVEQTPKRLQAPEKRDGKGSAATGGGTNQPGRAQVAQINPSLLAARISQQITPCWNIPVAAQGIGGLRAELNIVMGPDGSIQSVAPMDKARMVNDPVFRAFAESAVRAVRSCSPLELPPESYQLWRNIIFNFDPSRLAG